MDDQSHQHIASRLVAEPTQGTVRTAGRIEFVRDQGPLRRDIRAANFEWSQESLRSLAKILWASQRAHSYAVSALRLFSKIPSSSFSPDGLLGGRGYIQSIKDMRSQLSQAVELLSNYTDTLYDEVNGGHWDAAETPDSDNIVNKAEAVKENPDEFVENQFSKENNEPFLSLNPQDLNPTPEMMGQPEEEESESEEDQATGMMQKQAVKTHERPARRDTYDLYEDSFRRVVSGNVRTAGANSSIDTDTLAGPRVDSVGPGSTEDGWFNDLDALPSDHPDGDFRVGDNPLYDGDDASAYTNPTLGDASSFKVSTSTYSMLPGSNNNQIMPVYTPGITQEEIEYLINNSAPRVHGVAVAPKKFSTKFLWSK